MTKEDYMHLSKERLAELLVERDNLEELIENIVARKIAEITNNPIIQFPPDEHNPFQPTAVLYGCPSAFPDITYDTKTQQDNE